MLQFFLQKEERPRAEKRLEHGVPLTRMEDLGTQREYLSHIGGIREKNVASVSTEVRDECIAVRRRALTKERVGASQPREPIGGIHIYLSRLSHDLLAPHSTT